MAIQTKRIYEKVQSSDGVRVLVDRLWPRGISKEKAQLNDWLKEIAPSNELRKWFNHDVAKFETFKDYYKEELMNGAQQQEFEKLKRIVGDSEDDVTLLYGAKDEQHNQAIVLKEILEQG